MYDRVCRVHTDRKESVGVYICVCVCVWERERERERERESERMLCVSVWLKSPNHSHTVRMWHRSIFKRSSVGLNSEFSFSLTGCLTKAKESCVLLPLVGGKPNRFIFFWRALVRSETQTVLTRIWTRVANSIPYDYNRYAKHAGTVCVCACVYESAYMWKTNAAVRVKIYTYMKDRKGKREKERENRLERERERERERGREQIRIKRKRVIQTERKKERQKKNRLKQTKEREGERKGNVDRKQRVTMCVSNNNRNYILPVGGTSKKFWAWTRQNFTRRMESQWESNLVTSSWYQRTGQPWIYFIICRLPSTTTTTVTANVSLQSERTVLSRFPLVVSIIANRASFLNVLYAFKHVCFLDFLRGCTLLIRYFYYVFHFMLDNQKAFTV